MARPRVVGRVPVVLCLATALVAVAAAGQTPVPPDRSPQIFRGGTNLVYVDVYPRRDDRLVEGLRAQDFQLFEDGRPQTVQTFEYIRFEPSPVDTDRRDPTSVADAERQAADPKNRVFVVYLDSYHTTRNGSRDARQPLLDFLNRTIGASDLFSVMTPEIPASGLTFGRRTDTVEAELTKWWNWGQADATLGGTTVPRTPAEERIISCAFEVFQGDAGKVETVIQLFREDGLYTSLEGVIARLHGLRDERKNLMLLSQGWVPSPARPELANFPASGISSIPAIGVSRGGRIVQGNPQSLSPDGAGCRSQIARLAGLNFIDRFRDLVAAASQANVSFYPVDVGGLAVSGGRRVETLRTLAGATDGYAAVNSNDLGEGFRRVADRLSAYYLLGYYSTNATNDGRFRKIEVKVSQPRVSVAARPGYLVPSSDAVVKATTDAAARSGPVVPGVVTAALERLARLGSGQELFMHAAPRSDGMDVVVELAVRQLERGRWAAGAGVDVTVTDAAGAAASARGLIAPGGRATLVRVPMAPPGAGPWRIRARLSGDAASAEDRVDGSAAGGLVLVTPVAFRGAVAARSPLQPVAEFQFRRAERLHVEWPVLRPLDGRSVRLLDRHGQPLASGASIVEREIAPARLGLIVDLALASLADGDYAIEVTAASGPTVEVQLVAFRVGR